MPRSCSLARLALLLSATTILLGVNGQTSTFPATPLASKHFAYPTGIVIFFLTRSFTRSSRSSAQPYQVDTDPDLIRGRQTGYNQCNSTTEGPGSLCQTSMLSALDGMLSAQLPLGEYKTS